MKQKLKCGDCGRPEGEYHLDGCDIERCPKCHGQLLTCECTFPELSGDESRLYETGGREWIRYVVFGDGRDFGD